MGNKVLEFIIRAKDATGTGLKQAQASIQGMANKASAGLKNLAGSMLGMVGATTVVGAAVAGFAASIKAAFEFERYETQFKVLFGSLAKAKTHIADLQAFAAATPFEFGEIANASKTLHVMTNGVMGTAGSLKLVGDAAAATGATIGELSMWVGRAYGAIKGGLPFGEAAQRLMELGVLTPDVRAEMEKLQASGASNIEVWTLLETRLTSFKGGMEELSKTGEGLVSTLKDNWNLALAEFGKTFMDVAKDGIGGLSDKLQKLKDDGSIAEWAAKTKQIISDLTVTFSTVGKAVGKVGSWFNERSKKIAGYDTQEWKDKLKKEYGLNDEEAQYVRGKAEKLGFVDRMKVAAGELGARSAGASKKQALFTSLGIIEKDANEVEKTKEKAIVNAAKEKEDKKNAPVEAAKKEAVEKAKVIADMAKSQAATDAERAKEAAKKAAEEELKARQKAEEELAKQRQQEMKELIEAEKQLRQDAISSLGDQEKLQTDRLARAEQAASEAWAEYKDPELRKKKKEETEKEKSMREVYEKDKQRVGFKVAAGQALTDQEQAAQKVMQAEAEKEAAQKALLEIASNTAKTKEMLEQLLRMK